MTMTEDERDALYMTDPRAKTVEGFILGLTTLTGYMPGKLTERSAFGAEHDEICIWGDVTLENLPPDSDDGRLLLALGFHADDDLEQWGYFT